MDIQRWVRPAVLAMAGYTPGEQPGQGQRVIKLNTNENPWGPPEPVLAAIRAATSAALRVYPEPSSRPVREAAARAYGLDPEQVIAGNGSDDILTIILRTFVDPGEGVAAPDPTYTLYETLTALQGGRFSTAPWGAEGQLPVAALVASGAKVIFVVRPNAPTGHATPLEQVAQLCRQAPGVVILDEAYVDFADDNGLPLLAHHPNLIITRTFSKSLSLAGLRIGLGFAHPELVAEMHKVRDSYNLDRLAQAAAAATLDNLALLAPRIAEIRAQRQRTTGALRRRGFTVPDSQANFLLAAVPPGRRDGGAWYRDLKQAGVLVRHFASDPRLADKLRITIGSGEEMDAFLAAVDRLLADN